MYFNSLKFLIEDINIDNKEKEIEDKPTVEDGLERDAPATEPQIKQIKKILLTNINKFAKQKIKGSLDEDLGIFTLQNLNAISRIPILGKMFLDPMQTKGAQKKGTSSFDIMQYKKMQVIPFFLFNKDGENINAQNSKEEYNLLFLVPVVGAKITPENLEQHKVLFSKETSMGFKLKDYYESLPNIGYIADIKLTNDELIKTSAALKTDNISAIKMPINKKSTRKSSGEQNESISLRTQNLYINEEKNIFNMKKENYRNNINMNETIIKGKLSDLLFEEKNITESSLLKEYYNLSQIKDLLIKQTLFTLLEFKQRSYNGLNELVENNIFEQLRKLNYNKLNELDIFSEILRVIKEDDFKSEVIEKYKRQNNNDDTVSDTVSKIIILIESKYQELDKTPSTEDSRSDEPQGEEPLESTSANLTGNDQQEMNNFKSKVGTFLSGIKNGINEVHKVSFTDGSYIGAYKKDNKYFIVNFNDEISVESIEEKEDFNALKEALIKMVVKKRSENPDFMIKKVGTNDELRKKVTEYNKRVATEPEPEDGEGVQSAEAQPEGAVGEPEDGEDEPEDGEDEPEDGEDNRIIEKLRETFKKNPERIVAVNTSDNRPFLVTFYNNKIYQVNIVDERVQARHFESLNDLVSHMRFVLKKEDSSVNITDVEVRDNDLFSDKVLDYLGWQTNFEDEPGSPPPTPQSSSSEDEPSPPPPTPQSSSSEDDPKTSEEVTSNNIESDIIARVGGKYRNYIKTAEILDIINSLKTSKNPRIKSIFNKILSDSVDESFIYKKGIISILHEEKSTDVDTLNINDLFYSIYNELRDSESMTNILDSKVDELNNLGPEDIIKKFGMSKSRLDDITNDNADGPRVDISVDICKVFAYEICMSILENKDQLKDLKISGKLKKLDDIRLEKSNILYSEKTYNRLKSEMLRAGDDRSFDNLGRDELNRLLDSSVMKVIEDLCVSQHIKYDKDLMDSVNKKLEKNRTADERSVERIKKDKAEFLPQSDADLFDRAGKIGTGIITFGSIGYLMSLMGGPVGAAAGAVIATGAAITRTYKKHKEEMSAETFTSRREIVLREPDVRLSVEKTFDFIKSFSATIKEVYLESKDSLDFSKSLKELLFEQSILFEDKNEKITYDKVKSSLKSQKILSFGFPNVIDKNEAESSLTEAVCGLLEDLFDIEISGVSDAQNSLALSRIGAALDEKAKAGEPASEEIAIATSGAGVPPKLDSNMTALQLLQLLNQTGGDNLMKFMMLFLNNKDQMSELFKSMDEGKVTGTQAAAQINKASGGKMSELESLLEEEIKKSRIGLPTIKKSEARKLILTLKDADNQKVILSFLKSNTKESSEEAVEEADIKFNDNISKKIIENFNIVEEISSDNFKISKKIIDADLINNVSDKQNILFGLLLIGIMNTKTVSVKNVNSFKRQFNDATFDINDKDVESVNKTLSSIKIRLKESNITNDLFVGSLTNYLFERKNKNRSTRKSKVNYNSPEYLVSEMKRIWKL